MEALYGEGLPTLRWPRMVARQAPAAGLDASSGLSIRLGLFFDAKKYTPPAPVRSKATSNLTPAAARPGFVGRGGELAAIVAQRRRSIAGEIRVLLVTGDPGLGKTRLVERFLERHRRRS